MQSLWSNLLLCCSSILPDEKIVKFFMTVAEKPQLELKVLCYPNTDTDRGLKNKFYKLLVEMKVTSYNVASLLFLLTCSK